VLRRESTSIISSLVAVVTPGAVCYDRTSGAALGAYALFLVPVLPTVVAALLLRGGRRTLGFGAYAALAVTPFAPGLYVHALPYYPLDSYPILQKPLLRPATASRPARVCFVYGIAFGPRAVQVFPETPRTCVDLARTREASRLSPADDGGRTDYDLEWLGKNLARAGLPVHAGEHGGKGLTVTRVYTLPDRVARIGATEV
jgi:hypothetical protein